MATETTSATVVVQVGTTAGFGERRILARAGEPLGVGVAREVAEGRLYLTTLTVGPAAIAAYEARVAAELALMGCATAARESPDAEVRARLGGQLGGYERVWCRALDDEHDALAGADHCARCLVRPRKFKVSRRDSRHAVVSDAHGTLCASCHDYVTANGDDRC